MVDPIPNGGTTTDITEFRALLARLFTPGVIDGLVVTPGAGLSVNVSAGSAAVGSSSSITVARVITTNIPALAPGVPTTIYISYNTGGDLQSFLSTSTPGSGLYEVLAVVTPGTTTVTTAQIAAGGRRKSSFPALVGEYLTRNSQAQATQGIAVPGSFTAGPNAAPVAVKGVRNSDQALATMRYSARVDTNGTDYTLSNDNWILVKWSRVSSPQNDYDPTYANVVRKTVTAGTGVYAADEKLYAGPAGLYLVDVVIPILESGTTDSGLAQVRIRNKDTAGVDRWIEYGSTVPITEIAGGGFDGTPNQTFMARCTALMDLGANQYVVAEVIQKTGHSLIANNGAYASISGQGKMRMSLTLVQAN